MRRRILIVVHCFLVCVVLRTMATAQIAKQPTEATKSRVLDLLFHRETAPKPFYVRLTLRFQQPVEQLTLTVYPGGNSELTSYELVDLNDKTLSEHISQSLRRNPKMEDQEIAKGLLVKVKTVPVERDTVSRLLGELKAVKISPFLETRIAVDEFYQYDYWYDSAGESVHYSLHGPFNQTAADQLVQWMVRFREIFKR